LYTPTEVLNILVSLIESFFGRLKQERAQWKNYQARFEAQQNILNYVAMFYNRHRLHSYLGYKNPNDYERVVMVLKKLLNWGI